MIKPKLSPEQLVEKMKNDKGISFQYMKEDEAVNFLKTKNNYYRLAAYRKNYDKKLNGENKGKYIDLDFAYLVDLSVIDMHLRNLIFRMCLDIEHDLKVRLLNDITLDSDEDGYEIVSSFIALNEYLKEEIYNKRNSTYVGNLINKFFSFETHRNVKNKVIIDDVDIRCPIWAFLEIISFGTFIKLYDYYYDLDTPISMQLLNPIKSLRNACAHNNCIINNLRRSSTKPTEKVTQFVANNIPEIGKSARKKCLSVQPIFEFCSLLIVYDSAVSENVKNHRYDELNDLINTRMVKNKTYYSNQQILISAYSFIKKLADFTVKHNKA